MINTLRRVAAPRMALAAVMFAVAAPVLAQAPSEAQRSAIRSACRADYEAHCSSIQPGGAASLQCLQQNMASLSASCQTAVRAVEPAAAPKAAEPKAASEPATPKAEGTPAAKPPAERPAAEAPATAAPKGASPAAKKPSSAQVAAIRSACRADYQRNCASVPPGGAPALNCLEQNKAKLSATCQKAVTAATGGGATPAAGGAPPASGTAAPDAAPALVLRPMRPREELFVLRSACGEDVRSLCGDVELGGGRIMRCLISQAASISPACRDVLGQFAQ